MREFHIHTAVLILTCFFLKNAEHLIADEFSAELAEGVAYVAGHDDDSRPVLVII